MKILLVDDDEIIRTGMRKMISKDMGEVCLMEEFSNGLDAYHYVKENPGVHLIITDIRMPLMGGLQLIEEVRKIDKNVKFIVLSGFDEFNYVRKAFQEGVVDYFLKPINRQELMTHLRKLEAELKNKEEQCEYENIYKETLLSAILKNAVKDETYAIEQLREYIDITGPASYLVTVMQVGMYYKNSVGKLDLSGHVSTMKMMFEKNMSEMGYRQILYTDANMICSIILLESEDAAEQIQRYFQGILNDFKESFLLCVGISNIFHSLNELSMAYHEAMEAVSFKFYMGNNKVIPYRDIVGKSVDFEYDIKPLTEALIMEIELMDYPKVRGRISQFFLDVSFMKPEKIRLFIKNIIYILILQIKGFEKALGYSGVDYAWLINNIGTYNEMKEFILSLLKNCIQYMSSEKEKMQTGRIELVKEYLSKHYMEPVSLNEVAAYVELNPSYFSNLFKSEVGMNFSEYLMKLRMERAMQLLRDPKVRIYEIGSMVGYEDAVSFGRAFKKFVGMSPKEYRNTVY